MTETGTEGFSAEERGAMKERAKELKKPRRGKKDEEGDLLAKIAEMPEPDRVLAQGVHAAVKANAPGLTAKLWYGMPAYAQDGKVLCFFQSAEKFKTRYATFGFNDVAHLDDGAIWPTAFGLTAWTPAVEAQLGELIKRAVS